jgi:hypothetical protein
MESGHQIFLLHSAQADLVVLSVRGMLEAHGFHSECVAL